MELSPFHIKIQKHTLFPQTATEFYNLNTNMLI